MLEFIFGGVVDRKIKWRKSIFKEPGKYGVEVENFLVYILDHKRASFIVYMYVQITNIPHWYITIIIIIIN